MKFNELLAQVKEQTTPELFEKINANLTSNEVSTDLSSKHAEEVNELKVECDRLKLENETLNGEVEKLIKESDMMMQMYAEKDDAHIQSDSKKSEDVN